MHTWSRPAASTFGLAAALLAALVAASTAPGQATPPPCAAGVAAHPALGAADLLADGGDTRLFATHPITVAVGFAVDGPEIEPGSEAFALPPGATRVSDELAANGAIPDEGIGESAAVVEVLPQAGPFPVTVSWVQADGTDHGQCAAGASATFALEPAVPVRLTRPRTTPGLPEESTVRLKLPRTGPDLLPVRIRYRAVTAARFPGAHARSRTVTIPLVTDGSGDDPRTVTVRTGGLKLRIEPQLGDLRTPAILTFDAEPKPGRGTRFGYELAVFQGATRTGRLRVAGQCHRNGGFVSCSRRRISLR
jgi:hypothetical protein